MKKTAFAMGLLSAVATVSPLAAQDLPKVSIVVFGAPSLGAFLPPVIKAQDGRCASPSAGVVG